MGSCCPEARGNEQGAQKRQETAFPARASVFQMVRLSAPAFLAGIGDASWIDCQALLFVGIGIPRLGRRLGRSDAVCVDERVQPNTNRLAPPGPAAIVFIITAIGQPLKSKPTEVVQKLLCGRSAACAGCRTDRRGPRSAERSFSCHPVLKLASGLSRFLQNPERPRANRRELRSCQLVACQPRRLAGCPVLQDMTAALDQRGAGRTSSRSEDGLSDVVQFSGRVASGLVAALLAIHCRGRVIPAIAAEEENVERLVQHLVNDQQHRQSGEDCRVEGPKRSGDEDQRQRDRKPTAGSSWSCLC